MNNTSFSKGLKLHKKTSRRCSVPNPQIPYNEDNTLQDLALNNLIVSDNLNSSRKTTSRSPQRSPQRSRAQSSISKVTQSPTSRKLQSKKNLDNLPPLANSAIGSNTSSAVYGCPSSRSHSSFQSVDKYIRQESVLEAFLVNTMSLPLHAAIEQTIKITLKAETVTYWQDIPSLHLLYSNRISTTIDHSNGLVGYTFFSREIVKSQKASLHHSYNEEIDSKVCSKEVPVLLFPLWDSNNNVCGVVEVTRDPKKPFFDSGDEEFIQFFIKKFKIYSHWLFKVSHPRDFCLELLQIMEVEQYLLILQRKMSTLFECNKCEIWKFNTLSNEAICYSKSVTKIEAGSCGIVGESLMKECLVNCSLNKMQSSYLESADGSESEAVLVMPLIRLRQNMKYAVVLRGKKRLNVFTDVDEKLLRDVSPYLILALENNEKYSSSGIGGERNNVERQFVSSFKQIVDEISKGSKTNDIVKQSMEVLERLVNSDRSLLFAYNSSKDELEVIASTGIKNNKKFSIDANRGIVGKTFHEGNTMNIHDVYNFNGFDNYFDLQTEYKTHTLISVPVKNNRQQVIGVAQFMNKKDDKPFSNLDISNVESFMTFCGILMENDRIFNESTMAENELKCFVNVLKTIISNDPMKKLLETVVENAKKSVNADKSTLFLHDSVVSVLSTYITDQANMPATIPLKLGIAAISVQKKESIIVNDAYHDAQFNKMVDFSTNYKTSKVIASPIMSQKGNVFGVLEVVNKKEGSFTQRDLMIIDSFANICSSIIQNNNLNDICDRGASEVEMMKWIGDLERQSVQTPSKLVIPTDKIESLRTFSFNAIEWNGIGLFKVAFFVFNEYHLLEQFKINNDMFFTFLYRLRECYNDIPYHNWIHAIDVLQLYSQQMKVSHFDENLTGLELLAICIAAISHDVGHQGYDNEFHIKAKTPFGIMYKKQKSVTELAHCSKLINIINNGNAVNDGSENHGCNLFHSISDGDQMKIWSWIIEMILSTDISNHEKILRNVINVMNEGPINLSNEKHRIMAMTLLMKIANVANVLRPFDISSQWTDALLEEIWKQGDIERKMGFEITNPIEERNCDKEKLQIKFIEEMCIPMFQVVSRIFPELEINEKTAELNVNGWKERLAEKEKDT